MDNLPLAYFITVRTYGTWLHGHVKGSVDHKNNHFGAPRIDPNPTLHESADNLRRDPPFTDTPEAAALVDQTVTEVCAHRRWHLWAVQMRTNHLHAVVTAKVSPERVFSDLKAWCTRRLREAKIIGPTQNVWATHGSNPYLWTPEELESAIDYVLNRQGPKLGDPPTEAQA